MKTPGFWNSRNAISTAMLPLSALYDIGSTLRRASVTPAKLPVPVICIGNLTAGGAGKTPIALHIGQLLKAKNINAFFLSRGYGGSRPGPLRVDIVAHKAEDVGDEPLLLAKMLPTIVAKDRLAGAQFAIAQGAKAIIMDDGFQNPSIAKDLSLLVIDGGNGFGNGRLLPAGPMRETIESGFKRAQAIIIINPESAFSWPANKPVITVKTSLGQDVRGRKILAFAGLAYPQKFFDALAKAGAVLTETVAFPDHYSYRKADIAKLRSKASAQGAIPVTTSKDAIRLPPDLRAQVNVVELVLNVDKPDLLNTWLDEVIKS